MKVRYSAQRRDPLSDSLHSMNKVIVEWDWQKQIRPLLDEVVALKKQESIIITGNPNYDSYASLCGYLEALVSILGSKGPEDVVKWLENEKNKLETDMPFLILKHSAKSDKL